MSNEQILLMLGFVKKRCACTSQCEIDIWVPPFPGTDHKTGYDIEELSDITSGVRRILDNMKGGE